MLCHAIPEVNHPVHEMKCQEHNRKDDSAVLVNVTGLQSVRFRFQTVEKPISNLHPKELGARRRGKLIRHT